MPSHNYFSLVRSFRMKLQLSLAGNWGGGPFADASLAFCLSQHRARFKVGLAESKFSDSPIESISMGTSSLSFAITNFLYSKPIIDGDGMREMRCRDKEMYQNNVKMNDAKMFGSQQFNHKR